MILAFLLTLALQCPGNAPGAGWVCVNGGWLPPGHPGIPSGPEKPQAPKPEPAPTGSVNSIEMSYAWFDGLLPGELRAVKFYLVTPPIYGSRNCDGYVKKNWINDTGHDLVIKIVDSWMGANHDAPAIDVATHVVLKFPGEHGGGFHAFRFPWERYRATDFNLPDRLNLGDGFLRFDKGATLQVQFMCSIADPVARARNAQTGYHAEVFVYLTAR